MSRAAIRYAKAVLSLAQEQKVTSDIQKDMQDITKTIDGSEELQGLLNSALVKSDTKLASVKALFKGAQPMTQQLFQTLVTNKRIALLGDVAKEYQVLFDALNNKQVAKVTTAIPLNAALTELVKAKVKELTGNDAALENIVDDSIIGGFILRVGDLQYNASIAHRLTRLRRELSN